MKKLLGIVVLGLLFCNFGFAKDLNLKKLKFSKDIARGFNKVKDPSRDNKSNYWRMNPNYQKHMIKNPPGQHILQIVKSSNNHPTRLGEESLRFEVRAGDSWGWDIKNDRERVELIICCFNKTHWNAWSIYLPENFKTIFPVKVCMGQFHNDGDNPPEFMFQNQYDKYSKAKSGGYWITPAESISNHISKKLLEQNDMLGKWNDILVNAKWTHKDDGFFKIWINGKLTYEHRGKTLLKGDVIEYQLGIYRSFISRLPGADPTQVVYYDELRYDRSCKKLKLEDLGYSCKEIESQSVK